MTPRPPNLRRGAFVAQVIRPEQTLTERWEVTYTRAPWSSRAKRHTTARIHIPHPLIVASGGRGETVEEARIDALVLAAAGYIDAADEYTPISDETLDLISRVVRREKARRRKIHQVA